MGAVCDVLWIRVQSGEPSWSNKKYKNKCTNRLAFPCKFYYFLSEKKAKKDPSADPGTYLRESIHCGADSGLGSSAGFQELKCSFSTWIWIHFTFINSNEQGSILTWIQIHNPGRRLFTINGQRSSFSVKKTDTQKMPRCCRIWRCSMRKAASWWWEALGTCAAASRCGTWRRTRSFPPSTRRTRQTWNGVRTVSTFSPPPALPGSGQIICCVRYQEGCASEFIILHIHTKYIVHCTSEEACGFYYITLEFATVASENVVGITLYMCHKCCGAGCLSRIRIFTSRIRYFFMTDPHQWVITQKIGF